MSVDLLDSDEVRHGLQHPSDLGTVLLDGHITDALEAEGTEGVPLVLLAANTGLGLAHLDAGHQDATARWARSSAAGVTSSTDFPRRFATSSGISRPCSAATVACTTLIAFAEPS